MRENEVTRSVFTLPRLERVIGGPGTIEALPSELDRYDCSRAVIVTGRTVGSSSLTRRVEELLGARCAAIFNGARQHVPSNTVDALVRAVREAGADALISLGGGSPIDTAKCAVHALLHSTPNSQLPTPNGVRDDPSLAVPETPVHAILDKVSQLRTTETQSHRVHGRAVDGLVHIAVPTTLSAGEFTGVAGMTDESTLVKRALFDTRLAPRTVIADPIVTLDTPAWLWAASGVRALDHAIETLYAGRRHPISEPLAERAIRMLVDHLPPSLDATDTALLHRGQCQMAAWLAVFGVTNAGFGLSHVLGHQLGPRWNVAHGFTSAIMLPHAMRVMARMAPSRFQAIARAYDVPFDAAHPEAAAFACADRTAAFIERLSLPSRLRDVGVPRDGLGPVAAVVASLMARSENTDGPAESAGAEQLVSARDLEEVLLAAY